MTPTATTVPLPRRPSPAATLESQRLDQLLPIGVVISFPLAAIAFAALEWLRWSLSLKPFPITMTLVAAGYTLWAVWWYRRALRRVTPLNLGILGERFVADFLDYDPDLRGLNYRAIHDIPFNIAGRKFNVDHVLIGPGGIYAIETKYRTKPRGGTVRVRGDTIEVAGHQPDRDPIEQSLGSARAIADLLEARAGHPVQVQPILIFPRWFIEGRHDRVWVLSGKELPKMLAPKPPRLSHADIARCESLILDHIEHTQKLAATS